MLSAPFGVKFFPVSDNCVPALREQIAEGDPLDTKCSSRKTGQEQESHKSTRLCFAGGWVRGRGHDLNSVLQKVEKRSQGEHGEQSPREAT